jgi:2-polyprenyl-3-methyl-5-hydroxy-6-metoxy-1,4-benzoquinol methylase
MMTREEKSEFPEMQSDARGRWDALAEWWDDKIGEGNRTQDELLEPNQLRLLELKPGQRVLDIACGAGRFARRMAAAGALVTAFDQSERFVARAKQRSKGAAGKIEYHVINAADEAAARRLGEKSFDAAVCTMALMDMPEIEPLARWLPHTLKPGGRFVFSVTHPVFNSGTAGVVGEYDFDSRAEFGVKVTNYLRPFTFEGIGVIGQPVKQHYFHRPTEMLLNTFFEHGFVLDRLLEPGLELTPDDLKERKLGWSSLQGIPQVLIARLRLV